MGFSKYPTSLDDATSLPVTVDLVTPVNAEVVNRHRDAILAIEAELGSDPSRAYGSVKDRMDSLRSGLTKAQQDIDAIEAELGTNPSGTFNTVVQRLNDVDSNVVTIQLQIDDLQSQIDVLATA